MLLEKLYYILQPICSVPSLLFPAVIESLLEITLASSHATVTKLITSEAF